MSTADPLKTQAAPEPAIASGPAPALAAGTAAHPAPAGGYGTSARIGAEFAGSFILVFAGFGVSLFNGQGGLTPGMAFGLAVAAGMLAFGYISGGHFNPAITLGAALAGRSRWKNVVPYVLAQLIGAALASLLFPLILNGHPQAAAIGQFYGSIANGYADHSPAQFPMMSVLFAEAIAAAVLVAVYLGTTARGANKSLAPFAVGLAYMVLLTAVQPLSSGGLNPARSTAAVFFAEPWALQQLWLFWVAPLVGALLAALIFRAAEMPGASKPAASDAVADTTGTGTDGAVPVGAGTDGTGTVAPAARDDARSFFERGAETTPENRA